MSNDLCFSRLVTIITFLLQLLYHVHIPNHLMCNGNGSLSCGQCNCNTGRFGDRCQCGATGQNGTQQMCPLGPTELQCTGSNRGTCVCGTCQCRRDQRGNPIFIGPACECDLSSCPMFSGELCSGRGVCTCDGCRCNIESNSRQRFFGLACECSPDIKCVDPNNPAIECNGHGTCNRECNGGCQCEAPYSGEFCEVCSGDDSCFNTCPSNIHCAECALDIFDMFPFESETSFFQESTLQDLPTGTILSNDSSRSTIMFSLLKEDCPSNCSPVVLINATDDVDYMIQGELSLRCEIIRECTYRYYVAVDETTLKFSDVHVEFRRFCPTPPYTIPAWAIALAILITLGILGVLALLLLKLSLFILDVVEVRKFEKELANTQYPKIENPLYVSAIQNIKNPVYAPKPTVPECNPGLQESHIP